MPAGISVSLTGTEYDLSLLLQITHAVLLEVEGAPVRHVDTVANILSKIAPCATLLALQAATTAR